MDRVEDVEFIAQISIALLCFALVDGLPKVHGK